MTESRNPADPDVKFAPRSRGTAETAFDLDQFAATVRLRSNLDDQIKADHHINLIDAETDETFGTGNVDEVSRVSVPQAWQILSKSDDVEHACRSEAHLIATLNHHYEPTIWPSTKVDVIIYDPILWDR